MCIRDRTARENCQTVVSETVNRFGGVDILVNCVGAARGGDILDLPTEQIDEALGLKSYSYLRMAQFVIPYMKQNGWGRIVNVASAAQIAIDFDDPMIQRDYDGSRAYSQSKLAMVMATFELARRIDPGGVTVNALHPGSLLDTKMVREGFGTPLGPVEIGIESEVYLATSPDLDGVTGAYFDRCQQARADEQAYDGAACRTLWELSERLIRA